MKDGLISVEIEQTDNSNEIWVADYRLSKPDLGTFELVPGSGDSTVNWPPVILIPEAADPTAPSSLPERTPTPLPGPKLGVVESIKPTFAPDTDIDEGPPQPDHKLCSKCGNTFGLGVDFCFAEGNPLTTVDKNGNTIVEPEYAGKKSPDTVSLTVKAPSVPIIGTETMRAKPVTGDSRAELEPLPPVLGDPETEVNRADPAPVPLPNTIPATAVRPTEPPLPPTPDANPGAITNDQLKLSETHHRQLQELRGLQDSYDATSSWNFFKRSNLKRKIDILSGVIKRREKDHALVVQAPVSLVPGNLETPAGRQEERGRLETAIKQQPARANRPELLGRVVATHKADVAQEMQAAEFNKIADRLAAADQETEVDISEFTDEGKYHYWVSQHTRHLAKRSKLKAEKPGWFSRSSESEMSKAEWQAAMMTNQMAIDQAKERLLHFRDELAKAGTPVGKAA